MISSLSSATASDTTASDDLVFAEHHPCQVPSTTEYDFQSCPCQLPSLPSAIECDFRSRPCQLPITVLEECYFGACDLVIADYRPCRVRPSPISCYFRSRPCQLPSLSLRSATSDLVILSLPITVLEECYFLSCRILSLRITVLEECYFRSRLP